MTEQTAHNTAAPRTEVRGMDLPKRTSRLNHFWQRGYGARSVEASAIPTIRSYIRQHPSNDSGAADFSPRDGHLYEEGPR